MGVAHGPEQGPRLLGMPQPGVTGAEIPELRRPQVKRRLLGGIMRHGHRLLEVGERLVAGVERACPVGGRDQGDARLDGQRIGLLAGARCLVGGQVMRGQNPGQLLAAEPLEVARRSEVELPPVGLGEVLVGDLAHEGLHEHVLPALR